VVSILETTEADGKVYKTRSYNLDADHHRRRVPGQQLPRATQFRHLGDLELFLLGRRASGSFGPADVPNLVFAMNAMKRKQQAKRRVPTKSQP